MNIDLPFISRFQASRPRLVISENGRASALTGDPYFVFDARLAGEIAVDDPVADITAGGGNKPVIPPKFQSGIRQRMGLFERRIQT